MTLTPVILMNNSNKPICANLLLQDGVNSFRRSDSLSTDFASFRKVLRFCDEYVITFSAYGFGIIDPENSKVLLWTPIVRLKDIKIIGSTVLVFSLGGGLYKLQVATIDDAILTLHVNGFYEMCANICLKYASIFETSFLLKQFWKGIIFDLYHVEDQALVHGIDDLWRNVIPLFLKKPSNSNIWTPEHRMLSLPTQLKAVNSKNDQSPWTPPNSYCSTPSSGSHISESEKQQSFEDKSHLQTTVKVTLTFLDASRSKTTELLNQASFEKVLVIHDRVGDMVSTLVSTITCSAKSIRDTLTNPSPLQKTGHFILQSLDGPIVNEELMTREGTIEDLSCGRKESGSGVEPVVIQARTKKTKLENIFNKNLPSDMNQIKNLDIVPFPSFLKSFQKTLLNVTNELLIKGSDTRVREVLAQWLREYFQINGKICEPGVKEGDKVNSFSVKMCFHSTSDFHDLVKDSSLVFLSCFQHNILVSDDDHPDHNQTVLTSNSLLPEDVAKLDKFYADVIVKDENLIDYECLMNNFHSLEHHLLTHSWFSLIGKITAHQVGSSSSSQVLLDLEFTRAQRDQYLRSLAETGSRDDFLTAASNLRSPSIFFDIHYFEFFNQHAEFKSAFTVESYDCLESCLCQVSLLDDIGQLYAERWSACPQMQFEIHTYLFYRWSKVESTCACGFPRPNTFVDETSTLFFRAVLSLPIYQPDRVFRLFESKSFYTEMFDLLRRYNLRSVEDSVPYIIQLFHRPSINFMFDYIRPDQYSCMLRALLKMGQNDIAVTCLKCSRILPIQPYFTSSGRYPTTSYPTLPILEFNGIHEFIQDSVGSRNCLPSYSLLWQIFFGNILERIGSMKLLQLFHGINEILPQRSFFKRLFVQSILCSLAEQRRTYLRWTILQSFSFADRFLFSFEVRCALDDSVTLQGKERGKAEELRCQHLPKTSCPKDDIDQQRGYVCSSSRPFSSGKGTGDEFDTKHVAGCSFFLRSSSSWQAMTFSLPRDRDDHQHLGTSVSAGHPRPDGPHLAANQAIPRTNYHWGVKVQLLSGVCHLCRLGLTVEVMVNAGGLTVFSCGHAYHTVCLTLFGRFCIICHGPNYIRGVV